LTTGRKPASPSWSALRLRLADFLVEQPFVTAGNVSKHFGIFYPAAANNINSLSKAGILKEITGGKRYRIYVAQKVWDTISRPFAITEVQQH
jgi:Fic family protein